MTANSDVRDIGSMITYHVLTENGPSGDADYISADFYISNKQLPKLWEPKVIRHLLNNYGPIVGVMHDVRPDITLPVYPTYLCVLG